MERDIFWRAPPVPWSETMVDGSSPYVTRTTCRVCGNSLSDVRADLDLGLQFVNNFVDPGLAYSGIKAPIQLLTCKVCSLVQNPHTVDMNLLYRGNYWYKSGTTETMRRALRDIADAAGREVILKTGDIVLDIGSNDGTLLRTYCKSLVTVGVEPAKNLASEGSRGIDVFINDFWSASAYRKRINGRAKVITAVGMFYDMDDPNEFVADIASVLHKDGVFIAQLMCLKNMLAVSDLGNLAHEHLEYYTLQSLDFLFNKHGLEIYKIETNDVNGQSYRLYVQHAKGPRPTDSSVPKARFEERSIAYDLSNFRGDMMLNKSRILEFIRTERANGKKFWIYGASTKGNTILQYLELTDWEIEGAADKDPSKHGKVTIGSNITIFPEETMRKRKPDYCIVLPFAFKEEFLKREANEEWRLNGGKFLFPLPKLEVV